MLKIKLIFSGLIAVMATIPDNAFALDDGWYKVIRVKGECEKASMLVMYLEADKPVSVSTGSQTLIPQQIKKISEKKSDFVLKGEYTTLGVNMWRSKNNTIEMVVTKANMCLGAQATFTK